jgi:putative transposase
MQPTMTSDIVFKVLLVAVWRRPKATQVIVHSAQESQYANGDYRYFLKAHDLTPSMRSRGHCLDNAVAESFFHSLKTERVKRIVYATRSATKEDLFGYIEVFYNRTQLHNRLGQCLQINMTSCIHKQAKCLQNWGKIIRYKD